MIQCGVATQMRKACLMYQRIGALLAVTLSTIWMAASARAQAPPEVVGRVGDVTVTMADLDEAWRKNDAASRIRMLQDLYDTRRRALDIVIGDILIEREAVAKGTSRDELLAEELPGRTLPVTEEEITLLYRQNAEAFGGQTLEQMTPEIRMFLEQQRPTQALHAYMNELRAGAGDGRIELEPPRTPVSVNPQDPAFGPATAIIEIVEFSDFQCPFCERLTVTLEQLKSAYGDDIRLVFKDYPLPNHEQAFKAAEAGHCALEQDKFWELHDAMFANQDALGVEDLKRHAGTLGMDQTAFDTCLDSGRHAARVNANLREGQQVGVSSTPTVFVNGRAVLGAAPYALFEQVVEEELERSRR